MGRFKLTRVMVGKFSAKVQFLLIILIFFGCNSVKKVEENTLLLSKNNIIQDEKVFDNQQLTPFIQQKPNSKIFRMPLWLYIYNLADQNSQENYHNWLKRNPKTHSFLEKLLSKKQVKRLGESFLVSGKDKILKKIGEAPVILDTLKTHKSTNTLLAYLRSKGYFNAKTSYNIKAVEKKAIVNYEISAGNPYTIDSVSHRILSPELDSIYQINQNQTKIVKGENYNLDNFVKERERLNQLFRNQGFFNFQQEAINFSIKRDTLKENNDTKISVLTEIKKFTDRNNQNNQEQDYKIHSIGKIRVYTDYDFKNQSPYDTLIYKDVEFLYRNKLRFKPKTLYNNLALKKGDIYSDKSRGDTYRQISNLRSFRYPNIQYLYDENDKDQRTLNANVFLTPLSRFSLETNSELTHSDIQAIGIGQSVSLLARNVFKRAETLELAVRGTIGSQQLFKEQSHFFNVFEYGLDFRLTFPRILFFVPTQKIIPKSETPQTTIQLSNTFQQNIGLDKQKLQGIFRYTWNPNLTNRSVFDFLDAEFIRNKNPFNFFNVYENTYNRLVEIGKKYPSILNPFLNSEGILDKNEPAIAFLRTAFFGSFSGALSPEDSRNILTITERYNRITRNDLILATSYTYIHNNSFKYSEPKFKQFRTKVELSGALPHLFSFIKKIPKNEQAEKEIFGVPYAEYIKTEAEFIKHWDLGYENVLAFRIFAGIAIPFGNSKNIPFSRSYFAGGSNDNRGWKAYSLGPGNGESFWEYSEANFKFTSNLEYRFPIKGAFKGALFVDAGNIWHALSDVKISEWKLDSIKDIEDLAISSGLGLRYDFNFFVLRLDMGLKTYNPAKDIQRRWINRLNLEDINFNIGINYPF